MTIIHKQYIDNPLINDYREREYGMYLRKCDSRVLRSQSCEYDIKFLRNIGPGSEKVDHNDAIGIMRQCLKLCQGRHSNKIGRHRSQVKNRLAEIESIFHAALTLTP